MKTSATNKKVRDLVTSLANGTLVPRPEFQRRLVWTNKDKSRFIDTVINGYPFPEIYLADGGDVDLETGAGSQLLVDGQQRVTTLNEYFTGAQSLRLDKGVPRYDELLDDQKRHFLNYEVVVRDLGSVTNEELIEVFRRINSTSYSLNSMEINNASYRGEFSDCATIISEEDIFENKRIFNAHDYKRMGDVRFCLNLIISMIGGYINRDDEFESYLADFNEIFPMRQEIEERCDAVFSFLKICKIDADSRAWKKVDFLPLAVEIDAAIIGKYKPSPLEFSRALGRFYDAVNRDTEIKIQHDKEQTTSTEYRRSAIQASNDRQNRVRRGRAIRILLKAPNQVV